MKATKCKLCNSELTVNGWHKDVSADNDCVVKDYKMVHISNYKEKK